MNINFIAHMSAKSACELLRVVEISDLSLALLGAEAATVFLFLSLLNSADRAEILNALESNFYQRDEVRAAQEKIIRQAQHLRNKEQCENIDNDALPSWRDIFLGDERDAVFMGIQLKAILAVAKEDYGQNPDEMRNALDRIIKWCSL